MAPQIYYATYTAYDGRNILPQLIETKNFYRFKNITLMGSGSQNKGMALFPEKIKGKYVMLSRNDNENLYLMYSNRINYWEKPILLRKPTFLLGVLPNRQQWLTTQNRRRLVSPDSWSRSCKNLLHRGYPIGFR